MISSSVTEQTINKVQRFYDYMSNGCERSQLSYAYLVQFHNFICSNILTKPIIENLRCTKLASIEEAERVATAICEHGGNIYDDTNNQQTALNCFGLIERIVSRNDRSLIIKIAEHQTDNRREKERLYQAFAQSYVRPLIDYVVDNLTDHSIMLSLLLRYQKKCEWFDREELFSLYEKNTQKGEVSLNSKLYKYLFDSGIDIQIEPQSISGRVDFMNAQNSDDPIVADGKIFNDKISNILDGTHQIYQYAVDHQRINGYLIIYNVGDRTLAFTTANSIMGVPYITVHHKNLHFIVIDLFPHSKPASKRGRMKPVVIREVKLIQEIEKQKAQQNRN